MAEPAAELHPSAVQHLQRMARFRAPRISDHTLPAARAGMIAGAAKSYVAATRALAHDEIVPAEDRSESPTSLSVRVYVPTDARETLPAVLYLHGGGFVMGGLDSHDGLCHDISVGAHVVVVAVDYRLAPEHRYPAAFADARRAFGWLVSNEERLSVDASTIAVAGDSAGGGLAALLATEAAPECRPVAQVLLYPALDLSMSMPSHQRFAAGFGLDHDVVEYCYGSYAGDHPRRAPELSPLFAAPTTSTPPLLAIVGTHDPLFDETCVYVERLRAAGVAVELEIHDGMIHGFASMNRVFNQAGDAVVQMSSWLQRTLRPS